MKDKSVNKGDPRMRIGTQRYRCIRKFAIFEIVVKICLICNTATYQTQEHHTNHNGNNEANKCRNLCPFSENSDKSSTAVGQTESDYWPQAKRTDKEKQS